MNEISRLVQEAGVAGEGGAGFPAHVKYSSTARLFLVNGAECEPLLGTDQYIMAHFAGRLVSAALSIKEALGAEKVIFAVKDHYREQIAALKNAMAGKDGVALCLMESVYPAGDEQVLLYEAAGIRIPPGGIPPDSDAVVSNAGTLLAVADALEGRPLTHKYLTVSGAVVDPLVLRAPIGTSFSACIERAGGVKTSRPFIISGGPLMGRPIDDGSLDHETVTKTTSGIIVLEEGHYLDLRRRTAPLHMKNRAHASCIQCSLCSDLCPRRLLGSPLRPHLVMRAFAASRGMDELLETRAAKNALLCCECGICEMYACPMELQPCRINILIKEEFRMRGLRPEFPSGEDPSPARPYRRIPSERMAARAGISNYYGLAPQGFEDMSNVRRVSIPLKMHAGVPALPCVKTGEKVEAGSLIACIPQGKLGARIHASISGRVRLFDDRIVIEAESLNE
ncbi:MAG: 4Fe-4S dicluster domain-containing protein [Spirochaetaceae bacterium]|jgi:Na+-translocating ferredoxin:NAD+ oxidoreductase RnfC subunit|nr:4Fe-4S dicluster domain-containing protein [Spirochaetaceae bacterium]